MEVIPEIEPHTFDKISNGTTLFSHFTKFLSLTHSHKDDGAVRLSAARAMVYRLTQPKDVFDRFCQEEPVQRWLERSRKQNKKAYFIVGTRTYIDTTYIYGGQQSSITSAKAQLPVTELTTSTAIEDTLDISLGGRQQHRAGGHGTSYIPGEYVFDICYRLVSFKDHFYKPSAIGSANIGGNRWKPVSGSRGKHEEGLEVVEAAFDETASSQVEEVRYRFRDGQAFTSE